MKIKCQCGAVIVDQTDYLPHKAYIIPDQEWFGILDAIDEAIERDALGRGSQGSGVPEFGRSSGGSPGWRNAGKCAVVSMSTINRVSCGSSCPAVPILRRELLRSRPHRRQTPRLTHQRPRPAATAFNAINDHTRRAGPLTFGINAVRPSSARSPAPASDRHEQEIAQVMLRSAVSPPTSASPDRPTTLPHSSSPRPTS